jgi:hypothetical protein
VGDLLLPLSLSNPALSDEHDKRGVPTSSLSLRCTESTRQQPGRAGCSLAEMRKSWA